jgi:hypothetical protein
VRFSVKYSDMCGSESAIAQGADWHSDAGRKCKKQLVRTLDDINANKKALAKKKKTGLKAYNNEAVATVTKLIVPFSLTKGDLRGKAMKQLEGGI